MTKRETNQMLLAHWTHSWTTLGRWQELNSRLSREPTPTSGWMRRTNSNRSWRTRPSNDLPVAVSATSA
jgi:hypothetical protein